MVQVNRASWEGEYLLDRHNRPLNIRGRTGLAGRGALGKWGPNHAADPVVTRWQSGPGGSRVQHELSGRPVLEFVCIQRGDSGVWALPGGMVDPGEAAIAAARRVFSEEALDSTGSAKHKIKDLDNMLCHLFTEGTEVTNASFAAAALI